MGTSQATPHVAALMAMMMQNGNTRDEALYTIGYTAQFDDRFPDYYGNGIINSYAALNDLTIDGGKYWLAEYSSPYGAVTGYLPGASLDRSLHFNVSLANGTYWLIGWYDVDNNGTLNEGDFYGAVTATVSDGDTPISDVLRMYIYPQTSSAGSVAASAIKAMSLRK